MDEVLVPIHQARPAKASRIASIMTCLVLVAPKPWLVSPSGKRSSILSIWIMVRPPEEGGHGGQRVAAVVPEDGLPCLHCILSEVLCSHRADSGGVSHSRQKTGKPIVFSATVC
jgi:hypothetical protein